VTIGKLSTVYFVLLYNEFKIYKAIVF